MAMKKIKPQYGKVVAPAVNVQDAEEIIKQKNEELNIKNEISEKITSEIIDQVVKPKRNESIIAKTRTVSKIASDPNPFLQSKDIFAKAQLTKIGYRMRTEYVEILDIIKKIKKGGYTLEAVLDDALTYYFENSEDGREALKKAEIFYS